MSSCELRGPGARRHLDDPTQPLELDGAFCPVDMSCAVLAESQKVPDEEAADLLDVENEEATAPKTPKSHSHEGERDESPTKRRKVGDAEPTNSDLLAYMRHSTEFKKLEVKLMDAHVTRHEEQLEKVSRGFADLSERIDNLEFAEGGDDAAVKWTEEMNNSTQPSKRRWPRSNRRSPRWRSRINKQRQQPQPRQRRSPQRCHRRS